MKNTKYRHPLIHTLTTLKGNTKACVLTEPLWGIPYNLYSPYASLYMAALGMKDAQIGLLASIGMLLQFFWSMLSGALTDKYGRRWTTLVFDVLSWSVPTAIWAIAQGYWYFLIATIFNGIWRVTDNSWNCLLVDDCEHEKLVGIYSLVSIAGYLSGFVSPIAGLFIDKYTLVPTMRVLYGITFVMMTAKFIILYICCKETKIGEKRMAECKDMPIFKVAFGGLGVFAKMIKNPLTLSAMLMMLLITCSGTITSTFLSLFVTEKYGLTGQMISFFPFIRAAISLTLYMTIVGKISHLKPYFPLVAGFGTQIVSILLLLLFMPLGASWVAVVFISIGLESFGHALIAPLSNSIMTHSVDMRERARSFSMFYSAMFIASAPVGWISGLLSQADRAYPFILCFALLVLSLLVGIRISRLIGHVEPPANAG